jgi:hypothetical protein
MDLVSVKLGNNDAYSSIRGVYGGVGLAIAIALAYKLRTNIREALGFLTIIWGLYAFSRLVTMANEGSLGGFGRQWLGIETTCFIISAFLLFRYEQIQKHSPRKLAIGHRQT